MCLWWKCCINPLWLQACDLQWLNAFTVNNWGYLKLEAKGQRLYWQSWWVLVVPLELYRPGRPPARSSTTPKNTVLPKWTPKDSSLHSLSWYLFWNSSLFLLLSLPSNPHWSCFCSCGIFRAKVIGGNLIQVAQARFFLFVYLMVSHRWVLLNVTTCYLLHYFYRGNKLPKMSKFGS